MATTVSNNIVRMTADNDTYAAGGRIKIKGVRLVAGADAATALIKVTSTGGAVLCSLKAAASSTDECQLPFTCDSGTIWLDTTGTSPEVFIYLE